MPDIETLDGYGGGRCGVYYLNYDGAPVGAISVTGHARSHGELGYEITPEFRGQGFATEGMQAVVDGIAEWHGFTLLSAVALSDNISSHRVLRKSGFIWVGSKLCWMEQAGFPKAVERFHRFADGRLSAPKGRRS